MVGVAEGLTLKGWCLPPPESHEMFVKCHAIKFLIFEIMIAAVGAFRERSGRSGGRVGS